MFDKLCHNCKQPFLMKFFEIVFEVVISNGSLLSDVENFVQIEHNMEYCGLYLLRWISGLFTMEKELWMKVVIFGEVASSAIWLPCSWKFAQINGILVNLKANPEVHSWRPHAFMSSVKSFADTSSPRTWIITFSIIRNSISSLKSAIKCRSSFQFILHLSWYTLCRHILSH